MDWGIRIAVEQDAGEIMMVQRAAYVSEALLYDTTRLSALSESMEEIPTAPALRQNPPGLEFRDLRFCYPTRRAPALDGFSLAVAPGGGWRSWAAPERARAPCSDC